MDHMPNDLIMNDYYIIWDEPQEDVEEKIYIEDED
jgi:hypothetical protein